MEIREAAAWRCPSGEHVLGMTVRKGRQLLLYRQAVAVGRAGRDNKAGEDGRFTDPPLQEDEEVDVMAVVEGYVADVRCSICGAVRTWFPGEERIRRVVERGRGDPGRGDPALTR